MPEPAEQPEPTPEPPVQPPLPERLPPDAPITEVAPIHWTSAVPFDRSEIERYVEQPLVAACQILFDKKVTTTLSSANREDLPRGRGAIFVNYDNLTAENRRVGLEVGRVRSDQGVSRCLITIPVSEESTVASVSQYAVSIAERFEPQARRCPHPLTVEEAGLTYGYVVGDTQRYSADELIASDLFDYDEDAGVFYLAD